MLQVGLASSFYYFALILFANTEAQTAWVSGPDDQSMATIRGGSKKSPSTEITCAYRHA